MVNYSITIYKKLILGSLISLLLNSIAISQTNWDKPLKLCWEIAGGADFIASDNASKALLIFANNKINRVSPIDGKILWSNDVFFQEVIQVIFLNNIFVAVSTGKEGIFLFAADIESGISLWKKNLRYINERKDIQFILLRDRLLGLDDNQNFQLINIATGENVSTINNLYDLTSSNEKITDILSAKDLVLSYQGQMLSDKNIIDSKAVVFLLPSGAGNLIWGSENNTLGVYNFLLKKNLWTRKFGATISDVKVLDKTIIMTSYDNFIYLIDSQSGKILLRRRLDGRLKKISQIEEDRVVISAYGSQNVSVINVKKKILENSYTLSDAFGSIMYNEFFAGRLILSTTSHVLAFMPECK